MRLLEQPDNTAPTWIVEEFIDLCSHHGVIAAANPRSGQSALHYACIHKAPFHVIHKLIHRADDGVVDIDLIMDTCNEGMTALMYCCENQQSYQVIQLLVNKMVTMCGEETIKATDDCGCNALSFACHVPNQSYQVIQLLVKYGGGETVRAMNKDETNPLMYACLHNQSDEIIQLLIQQGGTEAITAVNRVSNDGCNALIYAMRNVDSSSHAGSLRSLIECGGKAALTLTDVHGMNALQYALQKDLPMEIIQALVEMGGKETVLNKVKYTAYNSLMYVVQFDRPIELYQLLIDWGGGREIVTAQNNDGMNALRIATDRGRSVEVLELLVKYGGSGALFDFVD